MLDVVMHWLGFGLCHQLADRSFIAGGVQLPVCARDTGIYIGFVASLLLIALLDRGKHSSRMPPAWILGVGAAAVIAMAWDGATSYLGLRETTNLIRLATGLGVGFALPLIVVPVVNAELWEHPGGGGVLGSAWQAVLWLASMPIAFAVLVWGAPLLGAGYAVLTAACIVLTFTTVNLIVVSLVPRLSRAAQGLRDAWPALVVAFAVTAVELTVAASLRLVLLSTASQR